MDQNTRWESIAADPYNADKRQEFADWLDAQGDPSGARAVRWMLTHRKHPEEQTRTSWIWRRAEQGIGESYDELPAGLFDLLEGAHSDQMRYQSRIDAEQVIVEVFRVAVANGWQPPE